MNWIWIFIDKFNPLSATPFPRRRARAWTSRARFLVIVPANICEYSQSLLLPLLLLRVAKSAHRFAVPNPLPSPSQSHPIPGDAVGGPTRTPASFSPSAAFGETQTDSKGLPVTNIDTPTHCRRSASPCSAALKLLLRCAATQTSSAEICRVGPTTAFPRPRAYYRQPHHTTPHLTSPHRIAAASRNTGSYSLWRICCACTPTPHLRASD